MNQSNSKLSFNAFRAFFKSDVELGYDKEFFYFFILENNNQFSWALNVDEQVGYKIDVPFIDSDWVVEYDGSVLSEKQKKEFLKMLKENMDSMNFIGDDSNAWSCDIDGGANVGFYYNGAPIYGSSDIQGVTF